MNSQEAWQKQQKIIEYCKNNDSSLIVRNKIRLESEIFKEIGILNVPENRMPGYIRLFIEDFIVEEELKDGKIMRINEINNKNVESHNEKERTLYADLIKIGIPTNVAVKRISDSLNIDEKRIGFAGLKDAEAITAQLIAFPKIDLAVNEIKKTKILNLLLTNFYFGKGTLAPGDLKNNIFTITVRTKEKINNDLIFKLNNIENYGVLNYFQSQRFGGLRLISHKLGKLILQGNYELAIKYFLFKTNEFDIPLINKLRKEAENLFPDYKAIYKLYEKFPYSLFNELRAVKSLINSPNNYIAALIGIKDQTQLWVYAYSSWLFNKYLSEYSSKKGCTNEEFPILLSDDKKDIKIYKKYLADDKTLHFVENIKPFKFFQFKKRLIAGRLFPQIIKYEIFDGGIVINFSLPKGSYATTFLSNLFILHQGIPIPQWVGKNEVDPKEILKQGNVREIKEKFKDGWYSKLEMFDF